MVLHIQSDASYLSRPGARSVQGGIFYLGNRNEPETINGGILAISSLIDCVVSAVSEAEYGAAFFMAKAGVWLRQILNVIGYPQPATEILCDNKCAVGLANATVKAKQSKTIDMRFHWLRDRVAQGQFKVTWKPGKTNLADFFTKPLDKTLHHEAAIQLVNQKNAKIFSAKRSSRSNVYWTKRINNVQTLDGSSPTDTSHILAPNTPRADSEKVGFASRNCRTHANFGGKQCGETCQTH
jgi:hypothetical protein